MAKLVFLVMGLACVATGRAQLTEAQLIARAKTLLPSLGVTAGNGKITVQRHPGSDVAKPWNVIQGDPWQVALNDEGEMEYFQRAPRTKAANEPKPPDTTEEEIWQIAEQLLAKLSPPKDLKRDHLEKRTENDRGRPQPMRWIASFAPRPYGYASLGNRAILEVRPHDAAIMTAIVTRGWTHEKPNIKVNDAEAKAIAAKAMGGSPTDWKAEDTSYQASYEKGTQLEVLTKQRILRLCTTLTRDRQMVTVDTVNGEVVGSGTVPGAPVRNEDLPLAGIAAMAVGAAGVALAGFRLSKRLKAAPSGE